MANWKPDGDTGLKELYGTLPAAFFQKERWFADRTLQNEIELVDSAQFNQGERVIALNLYRTQPFHGYYYYLPFLIAKDRNTDRGFFFEKNGYYFYDPVPTPEYISLLEELIQNQASFSASQGTFQFQRYHGLDEPRFRLRSGSSNSLLFVTRDYLLKNYRRIYPGVNPELKITAALTRLGSKQIPEVYGSFNYRGENEYTLGVVMEAVENSGTGWERWGMVLKNLTLETEEFLCEEAEQLGSVLAILHRDLAAIARYDGEYHDFSRDDLEKRIENMVNSVQEGFAGLLETELIHSKLIDVKKRLSGQFLGAKFTVHGDLHLEQVIKTTDGWKILDFEGEPLKSIPERENYDSPLKDLASMLRSISYRFNGGEAGRKIELKISSGLYEGYLRSCQEIKADFLPGIDEFRLLLTLLQIERAIYECLYESKYRPDWFRIPRTGLMNLIQNI